MAIGTTFKTIHDIMRKDVGIAGDAQRIGQLAWMLFLKVLDDREVEREEAPESRDRSPVPEELRWRSWAAEPEGMTGDALLRFVDDTLFPRLRSLPGDAPASRVVRTVFEGARNEMKSGHLLRQVVNKLSEIDVNRLADRHEIGGIYEQILSDLRAAGNAGEYYTPRAVTAFMVERVDPKLGEIVLDPACGTGGFLTSAMEHLWQRSSKTGADELRIQASIRGVEKKPLPYLLCVTNMLIQGGDAAPQILRQNALAQSVSGREQVDVILTNPPFGGIEEDGIERGFPSAYQTRETADLFLYLVTVLLRDGGRAAIVVPDGLLFGEGVKTRLKERLLETCDLHTIVRLPKGVFAPYTSIKTNLLFFTKGKPTREVWFYEHPYPEGYKSYSKTKPMRLEEFEAERRWWKKRTETDGAWPVSIEEIKARGYNLDIKNPRAVEELGASASALLAEYRAVSAETAGSLGELRDRLREMLEGARRPWEAAARLNGVSVESPRELEEHWRPLVEGLDALVSAPGAVRGLRTLISEIGVRGLLQTDGDPDESTPAQTGMVEAARTDSGTRLRAGIAAEEDYDNYTPYPLPASWAWRRLGDLAAVVQLGTSEKPSDYAGGIPVVRLSNLRRGKVVFEDMKYVHADADTIKNLILRPGDVLFARTGSAELVGKAAVFVGEPPSPDRCTFASYLIRMTLVQGTLLPAFLTTYLASPTCQKTQVEPGLKQQTGQVNFSGGKLKRIWVPVPPLAEQKRIVAKVDQLMALCDALEDKLCRTEEHARKLADALVAELLA
jgi:type I restriction enzyme M protein